MMSRLLVSTSRTVEGDEVRFTVRSYVDRVEPFVVLVLGRGDVTMHVFDLATLDSLQATVADARHLLAAALPGQDELPVEQTAAVA